MWWERFKKKSGSMPKGYAPVQLYPNPNAQYFYQEKQTYNWFSAPAHEQRSALTNCWSGNQLPSSVNFIHGVQGSDFLWNVPTSYANTLKNQQFNRGYNIQSSTAYQQSTILQQAISNWQKRIAY